MSRRRCFFLNCVKFFARNAGAHQNIKKTLFLASKTLKNGFFGLFLLVLAFFILISTTFLIAIREKNEIKKLISVGFGSWIFFQTVINLGGAVGIVPITGIVLPFVSYGSSAMISIFIALGIMYSRDYE